MDASPRVIVAICIIALGIWWTAANLGFSPPVDVEKYWPVAFIVIGLVKLASSTSMSGRVLGGVFAVAGTWIMADRLYDFPFHVDDWWPVLLIAWGVLLLAGSGRGRDRRSHAPIAAPTFGPTPGAGTPAAGVGGALPAPGAAAGSRDSGTTRDETVSAFAIWSGSRRRIASSSFRRADLGAIMGGVTLDLREASTATGEAVVDVFVIWGGINVRVPPDWVVSNEVVAIMGGTDDRSTGTQGAKHRLIVRGFVIMGGVEIKP
jgi:hypothetical protein